MVDKIDQICSESIKGIKLIQNYLVDIYEYEILSLMPIFSEEKMPVDTFKTKSLLSRPGVISSALTSSCWLSVPPKYFAMLRYPPLLPYIVRFVSTLFYYTPAAT